MRPMRIVAWATLTVGLGATWAPAQITVYRPSYSPVVVSPPVPVQPGVTIPLSAPITAYRPVLAPTPVVTAVPISPAVIAPSYVSGYAAARPVVVAPPAVLPGAVAMPVAPRVPAALYRPVVVAPGVGGLPNVYVPGQPIRNALRFALP